MAGFIGAAADEVVFTRNATEALNMVAYAFSNATLDGGPDRFTLRPGDEIPITEMEHHANLVPWQQVAKRTGATLRWFGVTDDGRLDLDPDLITERTRIVAVTHQSNVLGTINPIARIAQMAHAVGAIVVVDACQSVPHMAVDVGDLGAGFRGLQRAQDARTHRNRVSVGPRRPARRDAADAHRRFDDRAGLRMDHSTFAPPPQRFEAGVPNIAQAVGLDAACRYLDAVGLQAIHDHEVHLTGLAIEGLNDIAGIRSSDRRTSWIAGSGVVRGRRVHPHDLGQVLDDSGVAVRVGHHCACRCTGGSASPRRRVRRSTCTTTRMTWLTCWREPVELWSSSHEYGNPVPGDHPDHYRHPRGKGLREPFEAEVHHVNPSCGDEITLRVQVDEGVIQDISYDATGCSISQAATSVMYEQLVGQPLDQVWPVVEEFVRLIEGRGKVEPNEDVLGDGIAFAGVASFRRASRAAGLDGF